MKNSDYRVVAQSVLQDRGFDVRDEPGPGYLPMSRVIARKAKIETIVAIKASQQRVVSFTKHESGKWRTLHVVDYVVAIVPSVEDPDHADVYGFKTRPLIRAFDRAWKQLESNNKSAGFNAPVFVPLDTVSRKKVGHAVNNLKKFADWTKRLTAEELEKRATDDETYIDKFRRRFAADHGVGTDQVLISIMGKHK